MPTPRHSNAVARNAAPPPGPQGAQNGWVRGVVSSVVGDLNNRMTVALDSGSSVYAELVIEAEVSYGTRVWVVNAGKDSIIVALA